MAVLRGRCISNSSAVSTKDENVIPPKSPYLIDAACYSIVKLLQIRLQDERAEDKWVMCDLCSKWRRIQEVLPVCTQDSIACSADFVFCRCYTLLLFSLLRWQLSLFVFQIEVITHLMQNCVGDPVSHCIHCAAPTF